jgi:phosphatidylglycerophosphate synthase
MQVVIFANLPRALEKLCGVSLLERLLRILVRLGFREATIVSDNIAEIRAALDPPSWAWRDLHATFANRDEFVLDANEPTLVLPGDMYCDARLIRALSEAPTSAALIDSKPPEKVLPLLANSSQLSGAFISGAELRTANDNDLRAVDAALVPAYIRSMRRTIRPVFFPVLSPENKRVAERIIFDTGQNGTLDIPAILQSPLEDWCMRWLCRASITPNQLSLLTFGVALCAAALFASCHLWLGMIPALSIGVLDGLDGKQARVKIETTASGKWEHYLDFAYETAWWAALAFCFQRTGELRYAWIYFALIMAGEGLDKIGKHIARLRIGVLLDDYQPFDRFVRLIAARRDVYLWALAIGLAFGAAASTYRLCAFWGLITAGVHLLRGGIIAIQSKIAHSPRQIAAQPR